MKFKIDENLPVEVAEALQQAGYDAVTVGEEQLSGTDDQTLGSICQQEQRVLVTMDLGFADIRAYPPQQFPGIIVLRLERQDKPTVLAVFARLLQLFPGRVLGHHLWIVEEEQVRIRGYSRSIDIL